MLDESLLGRRAHLAEIVQLEPQPIDLLLLGVVFAVHGSLFSSYREEN